MTLRRPDAIRYGLVGTGHWAADVHGRALSGRADGRFVGVWGRDPAKTRALAERYGVRPFQRPADLFSSVDVVSFAVPPDVQAPLAVRAAEGGCQLLLEKPLALDRAAADEVAAAARDRVASVVFLTWRFVPAVDAWLERLRGADGWRGAQATWFGSIFHPGNPFGVSPWRRDHGALWDLGPHALSILVPALGPVCGVTATRGAGDTVHLTLRHLGGATSTADLSLTVPPAAARTAAAVYGTSGWSEMPNAPADAVVALDRALDALVASAATGEPHPCDASFGRALVHVLADAADGLATNEEPPDERPSERR